MSAKKKFVVVDPDEQLLFNEKTQDVFFSTLKACHREIRENQEELVANDGERNYSRAEEAEWSEDDYRIFQEI